MSANLIVDLFNTTTMGTSIQGNVQSGGPPSPSSGTVVGNGVFLPYADTFCNLFVAGCFSSGIAKVAVQCADADTSGLYTDPTSGLAQLPTAFSSGGILWINSGLDNGVLSPYISGGQSVASGFFAAAGFQRTGIYARALLLSGNFAAGMTIGFVSQLRTTGSGAGFSWSPLGLTSGGMTINV